MRFLRWFLIGVGSLGALLGLTLAYLIFRDPPSNDPSPEQVERTPARIARGDYLFNHLAACVGCHSEHDTQLYGWPVKPETAGSGQCFQNAVFGMGFDLCAPNLTPHENGLGTWTDGEVIRAIREGVHKDGRALYPVMPYTSFKYMSDEDVKSIVAYLRQLPPSPRSFPAPPIPLEDRFYINFMTADSEGPPTSPTPAQGMEYGRYLTHVALCNHCHTNEEAGSGFGGGDLYQGPAGKEATANLTAHPTGVTGRLDRAAFIAYLQSARSLQPVPTPTGNPGRALMPWESVAGITAEDLGAIYDYIKSQPPLETRVPKGH